MANRFDGYQHITQNTQVVFTTQAKLDEFKTKKLLGMKIIEIEGEFTNKADTLMVLKYEGVISIEAIYNWEKHTQTLRLYLK